MATVIGDRDVLLLGSSQRALNPLNAGILLTTSAPAFKVDTSGNPLPSTITIKASLIGISGFAAFTASGATVTDNHDNTATLAYSALTGNSCTITASLTVNGQAFTANVTLAKVTDGAAGGSGATGNQYATVHLYQWNSSTPANPTGTSGYTWATGVNSTYSASDGWSVTVPTNPGTPTLRLYVATVQITAAGGTASTVVSYGTASVQAWAQNGSNGSNGANAIQSAVVMVYQWAVSIPAAPSGTTTYTWSTGALATIPSGWSATPGTAPSQGMTVWAARIFLTDSATNSQTTVNWTASAVVAVGSSGSNGASGASGASYVTAYCASSTATTTTTPTQTTGKTSLPATNDGGITGTWSATVPSLTSGQYLYQSDGIYDPTTNLVTWSIPYWSSLKVGSLSAITVNTGNLTVSGTIADAGGNWSLDSNGSMIAKSWTLKDSSNNTILSAGGQLAASAAAPGTLNSDLASSISSAATTAVWSSVSGTGKPADNATVGAPSGTNVGGVSADTVASATNAVNDGTTGLAQRLRSNAANILSGSAGLATGNLVWDSSGNRTSGYGVGVNQKGIVAYNSSGVATFTLDGSTGAATFAGTLSAATGTFAGSLSAASGTLGTITAATIQSGSSGQRTVITQNGVNVYDSAGTLRVRMGVW